MALSYEFSIGSVRAKECSLFSAADIEQMLALGSEEELFRFLSDKEYTAHVELSSQHCA